MNYNSRVITQLPRDWEILAMPKVINISLVTRPFWLIPRERKFWVLGFNALKIPPTSSFVGLECVWKMSQNKINDFLQPFFVLNPVLSLIWNFSFEGETSFHSRPVSPRPSFWLCCQRLRQVRDALLQPQHRPCHQRRADGHRRIRGHDLGGRWGRAQHWGQFGSTTCWGVWGTHGGTRKWGTSTLLYKWALLITHISKTLNPYKRDEVL